MVDLLSGKERRKMRRRDFLRRFLLPQLARPFDMTDAPALILSPHQDDETLGCGGLVAEKRSRGIPVTVVFLTDGAASHGNLSGLSLIAHVARRESEARAALSCLGVTQDSIQFWNLADGGLSDLTPRKQEAVVVALQDLLTKNKSFYTEVFVPHRRDSHMDHEAAYRLTRRSIAGLTEVILYEYPVWLLWSRNRLFQTLHCSDLRGCRRLALRAEAREAKKQAMSEYKSQLENLPQGFTERLITNEEFYFVRGKASSKGE